MKNSAKLLIIGIVLFFIPLIETVYWAIIFQRSISFVEAKMIFSDSYPLFLQNNWLNSVLLIVSMVLFLKTWPNYKIVAAIFLLLSMALMLLKFWQMM